MDRGWLMCDVDSVRWSIVVWRAGSMYDWGFGGFGGSVGAVGLVWGRTVGRTRKLEGER